MVRTGVSSSSCSQMASCRSLTPTIAQNALRLINTWRAVRAPPRPRIVRLAIPLTPRRHLGARVRNSPRLPALRQLLEQSALVSRQIRGRQNSQFVQKVSRRFLAARGNSPASQPHHPPALRTGGNLQRDPATVRRGRGHFGSERGLVVPYRKRSPDVPSADGERGTLLDTHREEKIAVEIRRGSATALPLEAQLGAVGDTGRDGYFERSWRRYYSGAAARGTGLC